MRPQAEPSLDWRDNRAGGYSSLFVIVVFFCGSQERLTYSKYYTRSVYVIYVK